MSIFDIEPTMESVAEINAELNESTYKLTTSLYIADLLLEQRARASEDIEALVEATIKDYITSTSNKFKIILGKIKTFFVNLIKKIQDLISGGKKFITTYEKGILNAADNKDTKWIEYDERYDAEEILKCLNDIDKMMSAVEGKFNNIRVTFDEDTETGIDIMKSTVLNNVAPNAETYDDAKKTIIKKIKGEKTGEKKKLDKTDLVKMVNRVKKYTNSGKAETQQKAKKIIKLCERTASSINDKAQHGRNTSGKTKQERDELTRSCIDELYKVQETVMFIFWLSSQITTAHSNQYRYSLSVLKAFVSANSSLIKGTGSSSESKDTKENAQKESSYSLLENILEAF